jgi:endonuclease I
MLRFASRGALAVSIVMSSAAAADGDPFAPQVGYYDSADGLTGALLKGELYDLMRIGHIQRSYGDFRQSAALHDGDPIGPGNIILTYDRRSIPGSWTSGATWNREHVWPQSRQPGSASNSSRGNLGDPHALRPCTPFVNGSRGNKPFGLGTTIGGYRSLGTYYFVGDADRGDIARSLFYSDTRWGPQLGISLVHGAPSGNQMGDLGSLLEWHYLDVPDEFERRRNHVIATQSENPSYYTNNRNAFVDRPEFVWSVYVDNANDSRLFVGPAPEVDGSSVDARDAGEVFVGAPIPAPAEFTLVRDGDDGVYYEIIPMLGAETPDAGRGAFAIGGSDSKAFSVGFAPGVTDASGVKLADVLIDNLDVTTGGGAGRGANDADDLATVVLSVYDRSNASFDVEVDVNVISVDIGEVERFSGPVYAERFLYNLPGGELTAPLEVQLESVTGDAARFQTDLLSAAGLRPVDERPIILTLSDDVAGEFSAKLRYATFDDRSIPGAAEGTPLEITLIGSVVLEPCYADLTDDGGVDTADLATLVASWGQPGRADFDGSGGADAADLAAMIATWGPCAD